MDGLLALTFIAVAIVLVFDYTNGFHDAANVVATVIASRAMTPGQAVVVVGIFEFLGPLLGGTAVANTIGGFIDLSALATGHAIAVVLAGLLGAIAWNLLTWWRGMPSSSSHALVGGLIGATVLAAGAEHVVWGMDAWRNGGQLTGVLKVVAALVLSPLIGLIAGYAIHRLARVLLRAAHPRINTRLRRLQFLTTAALAFAHGANDAQKSMGIITLLLVLGGHLADFAVPFWVMLACATALTLGILTGGWRIVRTLGFSVYKVRPLHAFDSQLTSASVIFTAALIGAPVSTSHVVASSIMGIGAAERPKAVRWAKAREIGQTWLLTLPAAAAAGALALLAMFPFLS